MGQASTLMSSISAPKERDSICHAPPRHAVVQPECLRLPTADVIGSHTLMTEPMELGRNMALDLTKFLFDSIKAGLN